MERYDNLSLIANFIIVGIPWYYVFTLRWLYASARTNMIVIFTTIWFYYLGIAPQFPNDNFGLIDLLKLTWERMF